MSILIKGMEMPKNCLTCKLRGDGSDSKYIWDCPFTGFEYTREEGETGRLDECPLVEAPVPHGRLIDADALDKRVRQAGGTADAEVNCTEDFNDGILFVLDYFVKSMQTVIEAEDGDEHDT